MKHGSHLKVNSTLKEIKKYEHKLEQYWEKYQRILFQVSYLLNKRF